MRSLWLVARHEYHRIALRRSFLAGTLLIPVGILALTAVLIMVERSAQSREPIGYVDTPGILDPSLQATLPNAGKRVPIREYQDLSPALTALEQGEIQAVFFFPADYPANLATEIYVLEKQPSNAAWADLDDLVRANLVARFPEAVQERLLVGSRITVYDLSSGREFGEEAVVNIVLPFVATFFFFFATMTSSGYMLQVVADEKENRTMEVILTSLTPGQLIGGKLAGLLAAALTQLSIYVIAAVVALLLAAPYVPQLRQAVVPWGFLGLVLLFFFPAYALMSAVMVMIGSAVTELQQGQQVAGILNLVFMLPIFLLILVFENPNSPLVVFMTLFPTSSFLTVALRWGLGTVPAWQIVCGWLLLIGAALLTAWAAARVFRAGMLRYGKPLGFQTVLAAVRGR